MKLESNHGSSNGRCCFWCFSHFAKILQFIFYVEKKVWSECLGLVKHIYLIQTIILTRLLWLSGNSKICVSFADKYITFIYFTTIIHTDKYFMHHQDNISEWVSDLYDIASHFYILKLEFTGKHIIFLFLH